MTPRCGSDLCAARVDCENLILVSSWVEHGLGDRSRLDEKLREHLADERKPLPYNALQDLLARVAQQKPMAIITTNYALGLPVLPTAGQDREHIDPPPCP